MINNRQMITRSKPEESVEGGRKREGNESRANEERETKRERESDEGKRRFEAHKRREREASESRAAVDSRRSLKRVTHSHFRSLIPTPSCLSGVRRRRE